MLSLIKNLKIWGYVATAFAALLMVIGYKNRKIESLEEENDTLHKEKVIDNIVEIAEKKAEKKEEEKKSEIDDKDWRNNI